MKAFLILSAFLLTVALLVSCGDDDDSSDDDGAGDGDDGGNDDASDDDDAYENLIWQDPPSIEHMDYDDAIAFCDDLSFDGRDDWRLPTISELRSLIRGCDVTMTGGSCGVTDDCMDSSCWHDVCLGCDELAGPGSSGAYWPDGMSGPVDWYWSSSPVTDIGYSWYVDFCFGRVQRYVGIGDYYGHARCVR